jgi:hypothetical protein
MFASSIPEIIELVGSGSKYGGELKREHGKRYIKQGKKQTVYQLFQSIQPRMFEIYNKKSLNAYRSVSPTLFFSTNPLSHR